MEAAGIEPASENVPSENLHTWQIGQLGGAMKSTVALIIAVALVTLLPTSANATTLTIIGGRIVMSQSRDFGSEWLFGGLDFGVHQSEEPGCCGDLSRAFGVAPFVYTD